MSEEKNKHPLQAKIDEVRGLSPQEYCERFEQFYKRLPNLSEAGADADELLETERVCDFMTAAATDLQLLENAKLRARITNEIVTMQTSGIALLLRTMWEDRVEKGKIFKIQNSVLDNKRYELMAKEIKKSFDFKKESEADPGKARELGNGMPANIFKA